MNDRSAGLERSKLGATMAALRTQGRAVILTQLPDADPQTPRNAGFRRRFYVR